APRARSASPASGARARMGGGASSCEARPVPPASTRLPQGWTRCARAASTPAKSELPTFPRPTTTSPSGMQNLQASERQDATAPRRRSGAAAVPTRPEQDCHWPPDPLQSASFFGRMETGCPRRRPNGARRAPLSPRGAERLAASRDASAPTRPRGTVSSITTSGRRASCPRRATRRAARKDASRRWSRTACAPSTRERRKRPPRPPRSRRRSLLPDVAGDLLQRGEQHLDLAPGRSRAPGQLQQLVERAVGLLGVQEADPGQQLACPHAQHREELLVGQGRL